MAKIEAAFYGGHAVRYRGEARMGKRFNTEGGVLSNFHSEPGGVIDIGQNTSIFCYKKHFIRNPDSRMAKNLRNSEYWKFLR